MCFLIIIFNSNHTSHLTKTLHRLKQIQVIYNYQYPIPFEEQNIRIFNKPASSNQKLGPELCHYLGLEGHEKIMLFLFKTLTLICTQITIQLLFSSNDQLLHLFETDFALSYILPQTRTKKTMFLMGV